MSVDRSVDRLPFGAGAAAGVGAWVLTYLLTYLVAASDFRNSVFGQFTDIPVWKSVGWVFYNAHFVETIFDVPLFGGSGSFIGGEDGFTVLLYAVPVLVLVGAGLAVGRRAGAGSLDAVDAAKAGALVTLGYVGPSVAGVFLFATERVTPVVVTGILLAGFVYPLLFGALGGVVASATGGNDGAL